MGAFTDGRVTQFRTEFERQFEVRQSYLRDTVLTQTMQKGEQTVFMTSGSNGATATTRGPTGEIPARANYRATNVVPLIEAHDKIQETGFIDFVSQGDSRRMMQESIMATMNREMDRVIIEEMANATNTVSAAAMSLPQVLQAYAKLTSNAVDIDPNNVFAVITPYAEAQMARIPQWTSADYVDLKPFAQGLARARRWMNITWITKPDLPGAGTASASCFMYHRNAIGHAVNKNTISVDIGYNDENDYTYARGSLFHGAKLLQQAGIVKILHDDTAAFS